MVGTGRRPSRVPRSLGKRPAHVAAGALLWATTVWAQPAPWLDPQVEQGLAQQMAQRLSEKGLGEPASRLEGARHIVASIRDELDQLGESGVLESAPTFADFEVPSVGQQHLDAMARYQVCNMLLLLQHGDSEHDGNENVQLTAITGLTAVTMAIVYLRRPLLDGGGEEAQIEQLLAGAEMEPILAALQGDNAARAAAEVSCAAVLSQLLGFLNR